MPLPAVIVGGGLGGLSAAIHLRLAGHEVTIFEARERLGGRANLIERDGFRFDTGPSLLNYPWVFEDLFAAAGRRLSDYLDLIPVDPSVQFRWPDGETFQLSGRLPALIAECERLEPGSAPALLAFLRDAARKYDLAFDKLVSSPETSYRKWFAALSWCDIHATAIWRSLDRELARFFRSRRIREALGSYAMYLGGSPHELPGLFTILPYGELAFGLWLPRGGVYALVQAMVRLARELGVVIRTSTPVSNICRENGRVVGVELPGGVIQPCSLVVSNADSDAIAAARRPVRMTAGVVTFYWGVSGRVSGIGHHTIFLPRNARSAFHDLCRARRIPAGLPFYVSIPSETDPSFAPPGDSSVFVLVPVPVLSELSDLDWPRAVADMKSKILTRLNLEAHRIVTEEVWTPIDWRDRFALHDGSAFGAAHTLFQMGPFRTQNYSEATTGLYYTGGSTTPGTGMPMVVLGGKMTADRIAAHAR